MSFKATPQGSFSYKVKAYLSGHFGVSEDMFSQTNQHTVHHILRYTINYLMCENLTRMANSLEEGQEYNIIDLGAKYSKTSKWFNAMAKEKK
jgi:hypothetical protein